MAKKLSKRKRAEVKLKEEQKQQRLKKEEEAAKAIEEINASKLEETLKEEEEFFEFVRKRTNDFEYLMDEVYGLVQSSCGRRNEFDQPLRGSQDISFYLRFRDIQSELNKEKTYFTEKEVLQTYLKKNFPFGAKDAKDQTLEKIIICRLQYIESHG